MIVTEAKRGYLIAVEGCDRCGKSTQCHLLESWLFSQTGRPVEYWKFPDRTTPIGGLINEYLAGGMDIPDEAIHLMFSANRWELKEKMEATLAAGTSIILDRYVYSGAAYSAAKGLDLEWCKSPDVGLPQPDLVIFIDLEASVAQARAGYGEERYEKIEFQARVRKLFAELMKHQGDLWKVIDGNKTPEALHQEIIDAIRSSSLVSIDQLMYIR